VGVRKDDGKGEGANDDVAELDAAARDDIAKTKVVFAEELGEIVKEYEKQAEGASVEVTAAS
jgi:hypothetical protein